MWSHLWIRRAAVLSSFVLVIKFYVFDSNIDKYLFMNFSNTEDLSFSLINGLPRSVSGILAMVLALLIAGLPMSVSAAGQGRVSGEKAPKVQSKRGDSKVARGLSEIRKIGKGVVHDHLRRSNPRSKGFTNKERVASAAFLTTEVLGAGFLVSVALGSPVLMAVTLAASASSVGATLLAYNAVLGDSGRK